MYTTRQLPQAPAVLQPQWSYHPPQLPAPPSQLLQQYPNGQAVPTAPNLAPQASPNVFAQLDRLDTNRSSVLAGQAVGRMVTGAQAPFSHPSFPPQAGYETPLFLLQPRLPTLPSRGSYSMAGGTPQSTMAGSPTGYGSLAGFGGVARCSLESQATMKAAAEQCSLSPEVESFLAGHGFTCYLEAFRQAGFDEMETVMVMTQEDMRGIGMLPGHVVKLDMKLDRLSQESGRTRIRHRYAPSLPVMQRQVLPSPTVTPAMKSPTPTSGSLAFQPMSPQPAARPVLTQGGGCPVATSSGSLPVGQPLAAQQASLSLVTSSAEGSVGSGQVGAWVPASSNWNNPLESLLDNRAPQSEAPREVPATAEEQQWTGNEQSPRPQEHSEQPPLNSNSTSASCLSPAYPPVQNVAGVSFAPRQVSEQPSSGCTGMSVRTAPPGGAAPSGARFGAGTKNLNRDELDAIMARSKAQKKVFAWLQDNSFSNVNSEKWFLGRSQLPLHTAVKQNNPEIVKLLLEMKADPSKKNSRGLTPLEVAQSKKRSGVILDLLEEHLSAKLQS